VTIDPVPTSDDAARMLGEITPVGDRSRRLARDVAAARPLLVWGLAWTSGTLGYQFAPRPVGVIFGAAVCAAAAAASWIIRPREVRFRESERTFALLWAVLFLASPLLVLVAAPANQHELVVLLASLWAVGMLLYGAGTRDIPFAAIGLLTLVTAAVTRPADFGVTVLATGLAGGIAMTGLGAWRLRWRR